MSTMCLCADGTCEFCCANLYAIQQEKRLEAVEEEIHGDRLETKVTEILEEQGVLDQGNLDAYVTESDLEAYATHTDVEQEITAALGDMDLSEYVTEDSLEEKVCELLEDADTIVRIAGQAAKGAVAGSQYWLSVIERQDRQIKILDDRIRKLESDIIELKTRNLYPVVDAVSRERL